MSSRPKLKLDWCSHEAAKYAVENWHYTAVLPPFPHVRIGVWENDRFIGCLLFSRGASNSIGKPYGLAQTEVAELTRVALANHQWPVSRMLAIALRMLSRQSDGLRLLVSYADSGQGHHGGIYQATGWIYVGQTSPDFAIIDDHGRRWHSRLVSASGVKKAFGKVRKVPKPTDGTRVNLPGKYKYLMPLDDDMRKRIAPLAKPYPKRPCATGVVSDTPGDQPGEGGATPTVALSKIPTTENG